MSLAQMENEKLAATGYARPVGSGTASDDGEAEQPKPYIDPAVEKKLVRRIDAFVISIMGALYLMCFLDRATCKYGPRMSLFDHAQTSSGSANVATPTMSTSLGLTADQYGAAVSVVYATYVVFEPVWANLLKMITPKILMGISVLIWGILTLSTAWAGTYYHLLAIRLLLGVFEAGLFPCITIYIMMNYRREETGRRMSYIFVCAALSGAVGGLIAYGLVHIETGNLVGWQYLYVVEGAISLCLAPMAFFWIPNRMDQAWFLDAEQKKLAAVRYEINKRHYDEKEPFAWHQVFKALTDWKTYASGTIQFCADITLYGISTFMPQIIKSMGFSNVNAQLLTVPVYLVGAAVFLIVAYFSDKYQVRSIPIVFGFTLNLIGYIILATVDSLGGRYFSLFLIAAGLYNIPGLNVTWISNNTAGHFKRATAMGVNQLIGNSSGAAIGTIFLSTLAPRYFQSLYICMGLTALGIVMTIFQTLIFRKINRKREVMVREGAVDQPELGDMNPHFRYYT